MRLAVTGRISATMRQRVIAEHRAELAARRRATVTARVRGGVHPQRIPYGYRISDAGRNDAGHNDAGRRGGPVVIAPPYLWVLDPGAAAAVTAMVGWCLLARRSDAWIAARLNAYRGFPRPIDPRTGRPGVFTPAVVARVLTSPVYTGHQTWFRTRGGRPQPPAAWTTTPTQSHPALLDSSTFAQIQARRQDRRPGPAGPADRAPAAARDRTRATIHPGPFPGPVRGR